MKLMLISVGSRGDMEPFLAIAAMLQKHRPDVQLRCIFPEQFRHLAEELGLEFDSLGNAFIKLLDTAEAKDAMGGRLNFFQKIGNYIRLYKMSKSIHATHMRLQEDYVAAFKPDTILYHIKAIYPLLWETQHRGKTRLLSAIPYIIHPVATHPTIGIPWSLGTWFNRQSYRLTNAAIVANIKVSTKYVTQSFNRKSALLKQTLLQTPILYTISPSLFPRPIAWPNTAHVVGYHQRSKATDWQPDASLLDFLAQHDKVLLLTFGSMTNPEPIVKSRILAQVLDELQIPTIINTAAGGLVQDVFNSSLFHVVSSIPYDWLLPSVYGVIHHGGSGTTHMTAKYGCTSLILPHIMDQYIWDDLAYSKGIGPIGIPIGKISTANLKPKIKDLYENKTYKDKAVQLASEMKTENAEQHIIDLLLTQSTS